MTQNKALLSEFNELIRKEVIKKTKNLFVSLKFNLEYRDYN